MFLNLFGKNQKNFAGLDITQEGFVLSVLSLEKGKIVLNSLICKTFSDNILSNGIFSKPEEFALELRKIIDENKLDIKFINVSIPSLNVFIKTITFPDLPEEELKIIAPQEAAKHISQGAGEINVDFQILENTKKDNKIDVIMCVLSKAIANNIISAINMAGIEVDSLDIAPFSMMRTLSNAGLINNPDSTYVSVLIGYENTDINIIKNGMPVFSHNTNSGKKNVVEAVMKSFEINKETAKLRLHEFGIILPGMEVTDNPDLHKASNSFRNIYSGIASEIEKTIEFYNSQKGENIKVEKIIIGGSGVCVENIDKYISNKLRLPAEIAFSLTNITHNLEDEENLLYPVNIPSIASSIGAALYQISP